MLKIKGARQPKFVDEVRPQPEHVESNLSNMLSSTNKISQWSLHTSYKHTEDSERGELRNL